MNSNLRKIRVYKKHRQFLRINYDYEWWRLQFSLSVEGLYLKISGLNLSLFGLEVVPGEYEEFIISKETK